jgi:hypothetical protein
MGRAIIGFGPADDGAADPTLRSQAAEVSGLFRGRRLTTSSGAQRSRRQTVRAI